MTRHRLVGIIVIVYLKEILLHLLIDLLKINNPIEMAHFQKCLQIQQVANADADPQRRLVKLAVVLRNKLLILSSDDIH